MDPRDASPGSEAQARRGAIEPEGHERPDDGPDPLLQPAVDHQLIETQRGSWGRGTAVFDASRRFRFRLSRVWDVAKPRVCFVMLNPSTADAAQLDPTVRRCVGFAERWGAGALEVTNLFALRATDPKALLTADQIIGEGNDESIRAGALAADLVVCGWGVHGTLAGRDRHVLALLESAGVEPMTLGVTKRGHPRHPLYLRADLRPAPIDRGAVAPQPASQALHPSPS